MAEEKVFMDFDPNDFIVRITPFLDQKGDWTGELMVGTVTTGENTTTDDDYVNLMRLCHMVCASIPAMEEDTDIRDTLAKYANDVLEDEEDNTPKATVEGVEDNVVKVKFN
tara:strand:+ start:258 stop:590 length:333 start_codon:yes stop_codon:yes gene_type:complete